MSWKTFSDDCPGCRPIVLNPTTGEPLADDSPVMMAVSVIWARTTPKERRAFHRVCCQNSRLPSDVRMMREIAQKVQTISARMHPEGHA